ncbi:MAG: DUF4251 domain-containing protein [Parabacteroides sp.]|nr:DUF4251 domain-containing protein [Parabacteroides sp.]
MKNLILILTALIATTNFAQAQKTDKEERARLRQERKAEQEILDSLLFEQSKQSIENKKFVLEADRVMFKHGTTAYVTSNTNFVMVNEDKATVQIAFNVPVSGPNGIGGITVDGLMTDFNMKEDKKGNLSVDFNVSGVGISARINISLPKGSSTATINVLPTFNSNRLTLSGHILPLEQSTVFKGRAL